jgi:hypothetical protein
MIRIRDEQPEPGSYFREIRNNFFGLKYLKFFDADPGWRKLGAWITIPDPQHYLSAFWGIFSF